MHVVCASLIVVSMETAANSPSRSDDAAVWSAVVRQYAESKADGGRSFAAVLAAETVPTDQMRLGRVGEDDRMPPELLRRLERENSRAAKIAGISVPPSVSLVPGAADLVRGKAVRGVESDWSTFHKKYPNRPLMQMTVPAYNETRDTSVVYFWVGWGAEATEGWVYLLRREAGQWRVAKADMCWIS